MDQDQVLKDVQKDTKIFCRRDPLSPPFTHYSTHSTALPCTLLYTTTHHYSAHCTLRNTPLHPPNLFFYRIASSSQSLWDWNVHVNHGAWIMGMDLIAKVAEMPLWILFFDVVPCPPRLSPWTNCYKSTFHRECGCRCLAVGLSTRNRPGTYASRLRGIENGVEVDCHLPTGRV